MNATSPTLETDRRPPELNNPLTVDRENWPDEARLTFRSVLAELDLWSRRTGTSQTFNSWIAEEAVRRVA